MTDPLDSDKTSSVNEPTHDSSLLYNTADSDSVFSIKIDEQIIKHEEQVNTTDETTFCASAIVLVEEKLWSLTNSDGLFRTYVSVNPLPFAPSPLFVEKLCAIVHTSPEKIIKVMFDPSSSFLRTMHRRQNGSNKTSFPNKVVNVVNNHNMVFYSTEKKLYPLQPREYLTRKIWMKLFSGSYLSVFDQTERDPNSAFTRTTLENAVRGRKEGALLCQVSERTSGNGKYTVQPHPKLS